MAIGQSNSFNGKELEHYLAQMEFNKILCFVASCAEHVAPTVKLWSQQTFRDVESAIRECWEASNRASQSIDTSQHVENLELALQNVLRELEHDFKHKLPFIEDAIVSAIYMLEYAELQQVNLAVFCAERASDLAFQLACKTAIAFTDQHPSDEALLASEQVQAELYQQQHLLDVLSSTPMELLSIEELRQEAQQVGVLFLQWVQDYCELMQRKESV